MALRVVPAVGDALVIRSWAGIGQSTPDERPVLGTLESADRVHVGLFPSMGFYGGAANG